METRSRELIVAHRHSLKRLLTPLSERALLEPKRFVSSVCSLFFSEYGVLPPTLCNLCFYVGSLLSDFMHADMQKRHLVVPPSLPVPLVFEQVIEKHLY